LFSVEHFRNFFSGHERSAKAKKNITALLLLKGISILISFILVPMTLHYLNSTQYGIWLTLSSIIGWISYFDIGLGNGLRNKYSEAMANGDTTLAKGYVSTTYVLVATIMFFSFGLFLILSQFLNWAAILNAPLTIENDIRWLVIIVFAFFGIRFVFGLIGIILIADQRPAISNLIEVGGNILSFIFTFIIVNLTKNSLLLLGSVLGFSTAIVPVVVSFWFFRNRYRPVAPALSSFKRIHVGQLLNLGVKFFFLQMGSLLVFSTSNIIITQIFSPSDVVPYNIAFKYFSIASMAFAILLTPFWSAYTEAYIRNDIPWITRSLITLKWMWCLLVLLVGVMILGSAYFYELWVGKEVHIPSLVSISIAFYILEVAWCNIFVTFINGTGKVQLQLWASAFVSIMTIPLSIIMARSLNIGIVGIVLAPCITILPWCIVWPIQVKKILLKTAHGIWNR
jgi:O-antigen/teichoic acid export membrane protein